MYVLHLSEELFLSENMFDAKRTGANETLSRKYPLKI